MKKLISFVLLLALTCSISTYAFAMDISANFDDISLPVYCSDVIFEISDSIESIVEETDVLDFENSFYLYNFHDEPIAIFYKLNPVGYAIYDYQNTPVLEYSKEHDHPFYKNPYQKYYYAGAFNYYEFSDGGFKNLATGEILNTDSVDYITPSDFYAISPDSDTYDLQATEGPVYLFNETRLYNCNTDDNLSYFFPDLPSSDLSDCPGVCGSLACAILLAYYDDYHSELGDFVTDWKKTKGSIGSFGEGDPLIVGTTKHYSVAVGYKNISEKQIYTNNGLGSYTWINADTVISTWSLFIY